MKRALRTGHPQSEHGDKHHPLPALGATLLLVTGCVPALSLADDQDVIDYRRHIMHTMGEQVAAMDQMVEKKIPPDNFSIHAQILATTAATAKKAFEPKVQGGEAKAEVWTQWPEFSKRLDQLTAATAELAAAAKAGGMPAIAPKLASALTCKECHDTFRQQKK